MRTYFNTVLPAIGYCGRLPASSLRNAPYKFQDRTPSPQQNDQTSTDSAKASTDPYQVAVLILAAATLLTLF